ncbi:MAG: hypothetical protein DCC68_01250 [Planctomycetota bacterium]|nr:MAG: hypothetical protein DCC68_01250 [Planctomycetota bacterium]
MSLRNRSRNKIARNAGSDSHRFAAGRRLSAERLEDRWLLAALFEHGASDAVRVLTPTQTEYSDLGFDWTGVAEPFDDSAWTEVSGDPNGVGYDRGSGAYDSAIGLDVEASMYERSTTLFARATFDVPDASAVGVMKLHLRYDDAFIAWINGQEVARANTTGVYPAWDARALAEYEAPLAPVEVDISEHTAVLQDGENVIAIRLLNDSPTGDDALLKFTLVGESREGAPLALDDSYAVVGSDVLTVSAPGVLANDSDPEGDPLVAELLTTAKGGLLDLRSDGSFAYIRRPDFSGIDTFTYRAFDGAQRSAPARVSIQIPNTPPMANADEYEVAEDGSLSASAAQGVLANDTDPQHHPLTATLVSGVQHGTLTFSSDGSFTYVPAADFFGEDSFSYRTDDGTDSSGVATVTIAIVAVNDAPVAAGDAYSVGENETLTVAGTGSGVALGSNQYLWNVSNGGNGHVYEFVPQALSWSDAALAAQSASLVGTNGHLVSITSAAENAFLATRFAAAGTFWIGAYQNRGAADFVEPGGAWRWVTGEAWEYSAWRAGMPDNAGGIEHHAVATPSLGANSWNDLPHASGNPAGYVIEYPLADAIAYSSLIAPGAAWRYLDDGSDQGVAWQATSFDDTWWRSGSAQFGYGEGDEATTVRFGSNPAAKHVTTYFRHSFVVDDLSRFATLVVAAKRDDGIAVYLNGVDIARDRLAVGSGYATLADDADDDGQLWQVYGGIDPGLLRIGLNVLAVEIHQASGASSDLSFDLRLDGMRSAWPSPLANDVDIEGDALTAVLITAPTNGTLQLQPSGTFAYQPNPGFVGDDTFEYAVSDGADLSAPAVVSIDVRHAFPLAADDHFETDEDSALVVGGGGGVLANDVDTQAHSLTAMLVSQPRYGELTLAPNGAFTYAGRANFHGADTFTYRAVDASGVSNVATATILVRPVADAPVAQDEVYAVRQDMTLVAAVSGAHAIRGATQADFDSPGTPYTATRFVALPGPYVANVPGAATRVMVLTELVNGQLNAIAFDRTAEGAYRTVTAEFDFRIQRGGGETADGMGFVLLNTREFGATGPSPWFNAEEPNVLGSLGIGFDIFDNGSEGDNHLSVHYDGVLQARFDFSKDILNLDDGQFHRARLRFEFLSEGASITGELTTNGATPLTAFADYLVPGVRAYESRAVLAGRTGGFNASHQVDNVLVEYADPAREDIYALLPLVPAGAIWRYRDDGSNQGTAWRMPEFSDSVWRFGPAELGYGEGDEATQIGYGPSASNRYITTYFRHAFTVNDAAQLASLRLELKRDDGAAVYLNGVEIARDNLAADALYNQLAETAAADDGQTFLRFDGIDAGLIGSGTNVLAVEIHQAAANSSDVSFDARLSAIVEPVVGVLGNDADADADPISAVLIDGPLYGSLELNSLGTFTYVPSAGFAGVDHFTYSTTDGMISSQPATVRIVVSPPGKPPEDLNADGTVDVGDLAFLLASYGKAAAAKAIEGDLDGDGRLGVQDAIALRNAFTPPPSPAASLVVERHSRAVAHASEAAPSLRAERIVRRTTNDMPRAVLAATDHALATDFGELRSLAARRGERSRASRG